MTALLMLGLIGLLGVLGLSSDAEGAEPDLPDGPSELFGKQGQDDLLQGSEGNDTLTGNLDEMDVLDGRGGDDLLILRDSNIAIGGEGHDTFDVSDGEKAVITDFDPEEDALQVLFLRNEAGSEEPGQLTWHITQEGAALHLLGPGEDAPSDHTHLVTLQGFNAPPEDVDILLMPRPFSPAD